MTTIRRSVLDPSRPASMKNPTLLWPKLYHLLVDEGYPPKRSALVSNGLARKVRAHRKGI